VIWHTVSTVTLGSGHTEQRIEAAMERSGRAWSSVHVVVEQQQRSLVREVTLLSLIGLFGILSLLALLVPGMTH
jgi:hypothetical protein